MDCQRRATGIKKRECPKKIKNIKIKNMFRERLNENQKAIIKIYKEASRIKKEKDPILTRREIAREFFSRRGAKRSTWKNTLFDSLLKKEDEMEKKLKERRFPLKVESEREFAARRTEGLKSPPGGDNITDWKERIGLKSSLRGIYSKKQEVLRKSLKDLVKKGYLERAGAGAKVDAGSKFRLTERGLKVRTPRF